MILNDTLQFTQTAAICQIVSKVCAAVRCVETRVDTKQPRNPRRNDAIGKTVSMSAWYSAPDNVETLRLVHNARGESGKYPLIFTRAKLQSVCFIH